MEEEIPDEGISRMAAMSRGVATLTPTLQWNRRTQANNWAIVKISIRLDCGASALLDIWMYVLQKASKEVGRIPSQTGRPGGAINFKMELLGREFLIHLDSDALHL